jgi:hypothetical protein
MTKGFTFFYVKWQQKCEGACKAYATTLNAPSVFLVPAVKYLISSQPYRSGS